MKIVLQTRVSAKGEAMQVKYLFCQRLSVSVGRSPGATGLSPHLLGSKETQKKNQRIVW
jgi:hypothetical protein